MAKGFQSGKEWKGNRNGAPRREFRRDDFTDEFFVDNKEDIRTIGNMIITKALLGDEKAQERVFNKFFTVPKNRDDYESDVHADIVGKLAEMPNEKLVQIQAILLEQMSVEGEG